MVQSRSLVMRTGGRGGFLASVLDIGVVQPPGINVSADDTARGGAGGRTLRGGGTNPGSVEPSDPSAVEAQARMARRAPLVFFIFLS